MIHSAPRKDLQRLRVNQVNLGRIHEDFGRITSDNVDPGGGSSQLTVHSGRIHEDLERIHQNC